MRLIIGPSQEPFRQIHNAFLFLGTLFLFASVLINHFMTLTPPWANALFAMLIPAVLGLWIWSRFGRWGYELAGISFAILLSVVILPVAWFANGGINGPIILFYLATLLYASGLMRERRRLGILALGLVALSPVVLIATEFRFPALVHNYPDTLSRALDIAFSYLLVVAMLSILVLAHFRRFSEELRRSNKLAKRLRHLADHDGLTRLLNHRAGLERVHDLHHAEQLYALLFCDLDHFKSLNDQYGHPYGDRILRKFAQLLKMTCDYFQADSARYGGEEFLIIITRPEQKISEIDQYLRARLAELDLPHGKTSFSSGGTRVAKDEPAEQTLARADHALYKAKNSGRNRLIIMSHTCRTADYAETTEPLQEADGA